MAARVAAEPAVATAAETAAVALAAGAPRAAGWGEVARAVALRGRG